MKRPKITTIGRWLWPTLLWATTAAAAPSHQRQAEALVDLMVEGRFDQVVERFSQPMRTRGLGPAQWSAGWNQIRQKLGPFEKRLDSRNQRLDQYEVVWVTCQFAAGRYDVKVVYDRSLRVNGLYFVPAPPDRSYRAPDYADTEDFRQIEVRIGNDQWALPGTLTLPAQGRTGTPTPPALLLLHGSGPHDRDGGIGPNKPLRDLSWGLASRGIATLRYDKRTRRHAKRARAADLTPEEEVLQDARRGLDLLRREKRINGRHLFALGHSLGGTLLPRLAQQDSALAGLILLAGAARPLEDLIVEQVAYIASLDGQVDPNESRRLTRLQNQAAQVQDPSLSTATPASALPLGLGPHYWLYLRAYDPVLSAAALAQPMLFLQGGRDYQVTKEDWRLWRQGLQKKKNASFKLYPDLNHLFITGQGPSRPEEYRRPGHVAAAVIADIATWIKAVVALNPQTDKSQALSPKAVDQQDSDLNPAGDAAATSEQ